MTLSFKEVAEILKIIDASDCDEVVLELGGVKLAVRRSSAGPAPAAASTAPKPVAAPPQPAASTASAGRTDASAAAPEGVEIRAPMIGSFYRKPEPGKPPFVEEGSAVKAGEPVCLIEVMKLFTTIEAPCDGVIKHIAAQDGQMVEFDQLLFVIEPAQ